MHSNTSSGKKQKGRGTKVDMSSELLGFRFERPVTEPPTPPTTQIYRKNKARSASLTKSEFLQANFKFALSPFTGATLPCLREPDSPVPWEIVVAVTPPVSDEFSRCPICLDSAKVPKITRCGHMFCFSCILRHMRTDRTSHSKCPMCAEYVFKSDLRTILPLEAFGSVATTRQQQDLSVGSTVTFQLLEICKGSLTPSILTPEHAVGVPKNQQVDVYNTSVFEVLPQRSSDLTRFSRLLVYTPDEIRSMLHDELVQLHFFRQQCLTDNEVDGVGDTEYLPVIAEAIEWNTERTLEFDAQVSKHGRMRFSALKHEALTPWQVPTREMSAANDSDDTSVMKSAMTVDLKSSGATEGVKTSHLFYQCSSGRPVFLHPMCNRCILQSARHRLNDAIANDGATDNSSNNSIGAPPTTFTGTVLEVEAVRLESATRSKVPFLSYLPQFSEILLVEVDLKPLAPAVVLAAFDEQIRRRESKRRHKQHVDSKQRKLDEERRLLEELLRQERVEYANALREEEDNRIAEFLRGPALGQSADSPVDTAGVSSDVGVDGSCDNSTALSDGATKFVSETDAPAEQQKAKSESSFATITQMGGNFPSLGQSLAPVRAGTAQDASNAWGARPNHAVASTSALAGNSTGRASGAAPIRATTLQATADTARSGNAWQHKQAGRATTSSRSVAAPAWGQSSQNNSLQQPQASSASQTDVVASTSNKKGKVSLMSNASARSYR